MAGDSPSARNGEASIAAASNEAGGPDEAVASEGAAALEEAVAPDGPTEDVACLWRQRRLERNELKGKTGLSRGSARECAGRNRKTFPRCRAIGRA